jgi:hypothetical protein
MTKKKSIKRLLQSKSNLSQRPQFNQRKEAGRRNKQNKSLNSKEVFIEKYYFLNVATDT